MFSSLGAPPLSTTVAVMLSIWCVILVPWVLLGLVGTGMAYEGGYTLDAYLGIATIWVYPPLVGAVYFCRRRKPEFIWLPLLTAIPLVADQMAWQLGLRVTFR